MKIWKTSVLVQLAVGALVAGPAHADPNKMVRDALAAQPHAREATLTPPAAMTDELSPQGKALAARALSHGVTDPMAAQAASKREKVSHPTGDRTAEDASSPGSSPSKAEPAATRRFTNAGLMAHMAAAVTDTRLHAQTQAQMAAMKGSGGNEPSSEARVNEAGHTRGQPSPAASNAKVATSNRELVAHMSAAVTDQRVHAQTQAQMAALGGSGGNEPSSEARDGQAPARSGHTSSAQAAPAAGGVERAHLSAQQLGELRPSEEMGGRELGTRGNFTAERPVRELREPQVRELRFDHADRVHLPQAFYR